MSNRNSLLGRSKASEKLTGEQLAALDKATVPPVPLVPPRRRSNRRSRLSRRAVVRSGRSRGTC